VYITIDLNHLQAPHQVLPQSSFFGLHFVAEVWSSFNQSDVVCSKAYEFSEITHKTPFLVIQGHQFWPRWKANMRLPMSE